MCLRQIPSAIWLCQGYGFGEVCLYCAGKPFVNNIPYSGRQLKPDLNLSTAASIYCFDSEQFGLGAEGRPLTGC